MDNLVLEHLVSEYIYTKAKLKRIDDICVKYSSIIKTITQPKLSEHEIISENVSNTVNDEKTINDIVEDVVFENKEDNTELKNIYKSIVKKIHPDVNKNEIELYQETMHFYENEDIFNLKVVANKLNIPVGIDYKEITNKIYELNVKIGNKMNSYEWLYANTTNDTERETLILEYVSRQI